MSGQATELAALLPPVPRLSAPFVYLTGGKGGVGKTTIAANLGVHLAREGKRVLVVDLDLGLANLNVLLRLKPRHSVEEFFAGNRELGLCVLHGPGGVHILPAGSGTADMARPDAGRRQQLFEALAEVSRDYELVLGDGAAGIAPDVLSFAGAADRVLVVTTPEPAAMTDAYGVLKALHTSGEELGFETPTPEVLVNCAAGPEEAERAAAKLSKVSERFLARRPRLAGWLPRAQEVARSVSDQRPFVLTAPESLAAVRIARLSERMA